MVKTKTGKTTGLTIASILGFIVISFLKIIKPFKTIKLFTVIHANRIGHLALNNDLLLRRIQLGTLKKKGVLYLGICHQKVVNEQLFKMLRRKLKIMRIPYNPIFSLIIRMVFDDHHFYRDEYGSLCDFPFFSISSSVFYQPTPLWNKEFYELNHTEPNLSFTESEEVKGKELLSKMGIPDNAWFVCLHDRDSSYMHNELGAENKHVAYRNSNIENYIKAAEYITDCGGYVIRMGFHVQKELIAKDNPKIIDYATHHRTDFGDIYLPAKCKFFLDSTAGLQTIAAIFNIPMANANIIPYSPPRGKNCISIPKKLWSDKKKRFLTIKEQLDFEHGFPELHMMKHTNQMEGIHYNLSERYEKAGLKAIENTPQETLEMTIEMNERLDGSYKYDKEDGFLQKKYHSLVKPHHICYGNFNRIGAEFLKNNKWWLE